VPQLLGRQRGKHTLNSALGVVTITAPGAAKPNTDRSSGQAARLDVLDDLHQHDRVEPGEPIVAVKQRGLKISSRPAAGPAAGRA